MQLLSDPQAWVSFLTLTVLEIVLGIDNIIFLSILVDRLPKAQRGSARILGLAFAMLTRIALLFSITWLATLRDPLFRAVGTAVSGRRNWVNLLGGTLAGSVLFYFVSNTAAWTGDLAYAHTLAGWWQAVTVGHPQYYPTIFFFRNSLVSDLAFTACFALAMEYASLREGGPSLLGLKKVRR